MIQKRCDFLDWFEAFSVWNRSIQIPKSLRPVRQQPLTRSGYWTNFTRPMAILVQSNVSRSTRLLQMAPLATANAQPSTCFIPRLSAFIRVRLGKRGRVANSPYRTLKQELAHEQY